MDVIQTLTDQNDDQKARKYWNKLSQRLRMEGSEVVTNCHRLKLVAPDGKKRGTDCANREGILRIIQSIPSPKAEPFKLWLAKVGGERLDEIKNPALAMERMKAIYEQKGYPKKWIEKRIRSVAIRQNLTEEWDKRGAGDHKIYAILTNEIMSGTFEMTVPQYKNFKGIARQNLRDHMSDIELVLMMLAESTTTEIHKVRDSFGFGRLLVDAHDGGQIAGRTKKDIEKQTVKPVSSRGNFLQLEKGKNFKK